MTNNIYIACSPQIEKTQKRWQHAFSVCSQMEKVERCHRPFPSLNPTQTHCGGDDHAAQCGTPSSSPCEPQERGKGERARGRKGVMERLRGQRCRSERVGGVEGISANSNDARSRSSRKRMGWEKEKLGSAVSHHITDWKCVYIPNTRLHIAFTCRACPLLQKHMPRTFLTQLLT